MNELRNRILAVEGLIQILKHDLPIGDQKGLWEKNDPWLRVFTVTFDTAIDALGMNDCVRGVTRSFTEEEPLLA